MSTHGEFGEFGNNWVKGRQNCNSLVGCARVGLLLCMVVLCQCRLMIFGCLESFLVGITEILVGVACLSLTSCVRIIACKYTAQTLLAAGWNSSRFR